MEANDHERMDEENDDPVVAEYDVFFHNTLSKSLTLFQYPLRPGWKSYEIRDEDEVSYVLKAKPKSRKLEFTFPFPPQQEVDQMSNWEQRSYTLQGTTLPMNTRYAIAVLSKDGLHLTPLHSIIPLRPSFAHVNAVDENKRRAAEESQPQTTKADTKKEALPVNVLFNRKETRAEQMKKQLPSHQLVLEQQEEGIKLNIFNKTSEESGRLFELLMRDDEDELPAPKEREPSTPATYLARLLPPPALAPYLVAERTHALRGSLTETFLEKLSARDRVKAVLLTGKVMTTEEVAKVLHVSPNEPLCEKSGTDNPNEIGTTHTLLEILDDVALLLDSVWILKSCEFPEWQGGRKGFPIIRDYLITQFYSNPKLHLSVNSVFEQLERQVPTEVIVKLLPTFCTQTHFQRPRGGYPPLKDVTNLSKYEPMEHEFSYWAIMHEIDEKDRITDQNVINSQKKKWDQFIMETKANTFRLVQSRSRQQMLMQQQQQQQQQAQQQQQQTQKQAQKQASAPPHSQTATSLEHVVSPTPLRQSDGLLAEHNALLRPPHDDAQMPMSSLTPQPMLMIPQMTMPFKDETLIGNAIQSDESVATFDSVKLALKEYILSGDDSTNEFKNSCVTEAQLATALEAVCENVQNVYCLRERIEENNITNTYRALIINAFKHSPTIKKTELKQIITKNTSEPFDAASYQKATFELLVSSGNSFTFKGYSV